MRHMVLILASIPTLTLAQHEIIAQAYEVVFSGKDLVCKSRLFTEPDVK